ncbi:hypothetical protein K9L05_01470 [Candidatus Babeliales bacterium]|nr:hypothetical protein [Candidatus Babeliales bacterium]
MIKKIMTIALLLSLSIPYGQAMLSPGKQIQVTKTPIRFICNKEQYNEITTAFGFEEKKILGPRECVEPNIFRPIPICRSRGNLLAEVSYYSNSSVRWPESFQSNQIVNTKICFVCKPHILQKISVYGINAMMSIIQMDSNVCVAEVLYGPNGGVRGLDLSGASYADNTEQPEEPRTETTESSTPEDYKRYQRPPSVASGNTHHQQCFSGIQVTGYDANAGGSVVEIDEQRTVVPCDNPISNQRLSNIEVTGLDFSDSNLGNVGPSVRINGQRII